jgi:hypothetical protein
LIYIIKQKDGWDEKQIRGNKKLEVLVIVIALPVLLQEGTAGHSAQE